MNSKEKRKRKFGKINRSKMYESYTFTQCACTCGCTDAGSLAAQGYYTYGLGVHLSNENINVCNGFIN